MTELKPCPFCGGNAFIVVDHDAVVDTRGRYWGGTQPSVVSAAQRLGLPIRLKKREKHGTGGLTVATKWICDSCGAEINPMSSVTYAGMRRLKMDINDNDYELCVSCAHKLRTWLSGKEN